MRSSLIYSNIIHFGIICMVFFLIHAFWYHFIYRGALWCAFGFYGHRLDFLIIFCLSFVHRFVNWLVWCEQVKRSNGNIMNESDCLMLKNFNSMHPTLTSKLNYYFFVFFLLLYSCTLSAQVTWSIFNCT